MCYITMISVSTINYHACYTSHPTDIIPNASSKLDKCASLGWPRSHHGASSEIK